MALSDFVRHPRRLGFVGFNILALVLAVLWFTTRTDNAEAGLSGLPNVVLTTVGMAILFALWAGMWIAWGVMVWQRHRRRTSPT
jgi:hypothetical protein